MNLAAPVRDYLEAIPLLSPRFTKEVTKVTTAGPGAGRWYSAAGPDGEADWRL
jgi:hypothetical protein